MTLKPSFHTQDYCSKMICSSLLLKKIHSNNSLNSSIFIEFLDHIFHFQIHISWLEKIQMKQCQTKIWCYMLRIAFTFNVCDCFVFCHCLFLSFCFFISISLVDKGGTEAQDCVTTVSWHGVWSWVIVAGLQSVRGISSLCCPRAGNQAWAAVSQHIPPRSSVLLWGKFLCDLCHSLLCSKKKKNHTECRSLAHPRVIDPWLRAERLPDRKNDEISYFM